MKILCYSSFTFSYLNRARVLFQTLRQHRPDWELAALITDRPPQGFVFDPATEPFDRLVWASDLDIPESAVARTHLSGAAVPLEFQAKVAELVARFDLSPALIEALVWQESRWRPGAVSRSSLKSC